MLFVAAPRFFIGDLAEEHGNGGFAHLPVWLIHSRNVHAPEMEIIIGANN